MMGTFHVPPCHVPPFMYPHYMNPTQPLQGSQVNVQTKRSKLVNRNSSIFRMGGEKSAPQKSFVKILSFLFLFNFLSLLFIPLSWSRICYCSAVIGFQFFLLPFIYLLLNLMMKQTKNNLIYCLQRPQLLFFQGGRIQTTPSKGVWSRHSNFLRMCSQITGQTGQKEGLSSQAWRQMTDVTHELGGGVHSLSSTQCAV